MDPKKGSKFAGMKEFIEYKVSSPVRSSFPLERDDSNVLTGYSLLLSCIFLFSLVMASGVKLRGALSILTGSMTG